MNMDRRTFLNRSAAIAGTTLLSSCSGPNHVLIQRAEPGSSSQPESVFGVPGAAGLAAPLRLPASMPMGSGAPLGGIGTGFVEIRADGCFHEWQIFNSGPWAQDVPSTTNLSGSGPQVLRFLLRTRRSSQQTALIRRLYLRSDDNDLYTLPYVQDVKSIEYSSWFPLTSLAYEDETLPVRVSSVLFSPFIPGDARVSGTPGFHVVFTVENTSDEPVEVSLAGFLDNPLASALKERRLTNTRLTTEQATGILFQTEAQTDFPSGIGSLAFTVSGGKPSWITGTFRSYLPPGVCQWKTPRVRFMLLTLLSEWWRTGCLPNSDCATDPSLHLPTDEQIAAFTDDQVRDCLRELSRDALLARVVAEALAADPGQQNKLSRELLREIRANLPATPGEGDRLNWGSGALNSSSTLAPGQKVEIRFTLSWFFPHHLTRSRHEIGHMYGNWFKDAAEVNSFLCAHYDEHRRKTESFARTLADTSLGEAMAFAWSGQLSTAVFNTWWTRDGGYAIWEGLGCCGLSTTDVDYQGSFPIVALFPELKLEQMRRTASYQNDKGQIPHNFPAEMDRVDDGFERVDMNSQFVMMVCRDYLWTGDRDYLQHMWPHVLKAMAFTETLDTNGDALPDRETGLQTYDQWRMQGTPAYIASLWLGALRAAIRLAGDLGQSQDVQRWSALLATASASFDRLLFNGEYYSLWVDGDRRDELCMTDQVSGEWFTHMIGLPSTLGRENLDRAIQSVWVNNFNPEFGLHNATAPKGSPQQQLALTNLQAGGVWSGIEFAFASLLMDFGRYADGARIVETVHRRYLRAGMPWNHTECGGHYSRAMSSWCTLLAATGFKPDWPNRILTLTPTVSGNFHAPWATASGFGTVRRTDGKIVLTCVEGNLEFQRLKAPKGFQHLQLNQQPLSAQTRQEDLAVFELANPLTLSAGQTLSVLE